MFTIKFSIICKPLYFNNVFLNYIYTYTHIYIYRERERERGGIERKKEREKVRVELSCLTFYVRL